LSGILEFGLTQDLMRVIASLILFLIGAVFIFRFFKLFFLVVSRDKNQDHARV
jgi:hypothetical protein